VGGPFAFPELVPLLRAKYLTDVPLRAGQALLFNQRLFHCSGPNLSNTDRVAATAVLVPRDSTLRYYHTNSDESGGGIEVFEVDPTFYTRHSIGSRPRTGKLIATLPSGP
jgi:ectoine hydroxylase-related dioxygenase (phytanoyl-CoA dioxygenase family)